MTAQLTIAARELVDEPLAALTALVVDCQTSGSRPAHDHIIELGWTLTRAAETSPALRSSLLALPAGERLARRIQRIVGIDEDELARAPASASVWRDFNADLARARVLIAHVARFERGFLEALAQRHDGVFDIDPICTHALAVRLLPRLPRRGLRAVAGYLGYPLTSELKRAAAHVEATLHVWRELVARLESEHSITTLGGLREFVAQTKARPTGRHTPLSRDTRLSLPDAPGVYELLGARGEVLYAGKATSLKTRVNSYFRKRRVGSGGGRNERVAELLCQVHDVRVHQTPTALEAALRECEVILREQPPYNVRLRGDNGPLGEAIVADVPVAPLPSAASAERLERVLSCVEGDLEAALALLWRAEADDDVRAIVAEGLRVFVERNARHGVAPAVCLLRAARPPDRAGADDDDEDDDVGLTAEAEPEAEADGADDDLPTAEGVLEVLEEAMQLAARQWRRARWLSSLAQAELTFREPGAEAPRTLSLGEPCTDRAAYDRLSVLTSELKRLAHAGVELALQTGRRRYDARALARRLRWV